MQTLSARSIVPSRLPFRGRVREALRLQSANLQLCSPSPLSHPPLQVHVRRFHNMQRRDNQSPSRFTGIHVPSRYPHGLRSPTGIHKSTSRTHTRLHQWPSPLAPVHVPQSSPHGTVPVRPVKQVKLGAHLARRSFFTGLLAEGVNLLFGRKLAWWWKLRAGGTCIWAGHIGIIND